MICIKLNSIKPSNYPHIRHISQQTMIQPVPSHNVMIQHHLMKIDLSPNAFTHSFTDHTVVSSLSAPASDLMIQRDDDCPTGRKSFPAAGALLYIF